MIIIQLCADNLLVLFVLPGTQVERTGGRVETRRTETQESDLAAAASTVLSAEWMLGEWSLRGCTQTKGEGA